MLYFWNGALSTDISNLAGGFVYRNDGISLSRSAGGVWLQVQNQQVPSDSTGLMRGGRREPISSAWASELTAQGYGAYVDQVAGYGDVYVDSFAD